MSRVLTGVFVHFSLLLHVRVTICALPDRYWQSAAEKKGESPLKVRLVADTCQIIRVAVHLQ